MAFKNTSYGNGNALAKQFYALSGKATLAEIPWLYSANGPLGGGGREKMAAGADAFMGQPMAAEGPGPGSGGAGSFAVSPPPSPGLPGPFPSDTNGSFPSPFNRGIRGPRGGEGGDFSGTDALRAGAADFSLGNLATAGQFAAGLMSGTGPILNMAQLAADELLGTGSPMPSFTGQFNPADFLAPDEIAELQGAYNSTAARHIQARLMGLARQRHAQQQQAGLEREWNAPAGAPGDIAGNFAPPGTMMGQDVLANSNALRNFAGNRGGNQNGAGGRRGGMGGVGSDRARNAANAPGGPRGGVGI